MSVMINSPDERTNPECLCANVLIVDDDPFNLIVLEGLLKSCGVTKIDKAFNGKEGLA